jgi:MYXO-CTERM domain-containing protein
MRETAPVFENGALVFGPHWAGWVLRHPARAGRIGRRFRVMSKTTLAAALAVAAVTGAAHAQGVLANWTFETSVPATAGPFAAEGGINGATSQASGFHAGAAAYSSPAGNGSAHSFSSNTWAINDYYQFTTSTLGFTNIRFQWDQTSSNTGPRDFSLMWSTDGVTFTSLATTTVLANASPNPVWNATTASPIYTTGPLAAPAALNNQAIVYFRLVDMSTVSANGGTVATAGTDRIDNVTISSVPGPGAAALLGVGGLIVLRRRR